MSRIQKYRYGYVSRGQQQRLTPKSEFLKSLEKRQAQAETQRAVAKMQGALKPATRGLKRQDEIFSYLLQRQAE